MELTTEQATKMDRLTDRAIDLLEVEDDDSPEHAENIRTALSAMVSWWQRIMLDVDMASYEAEQMADADRRMAELEVEAMRHAENDAEGRELVAMAAEYEDDIPF